MHIGIVAQRSNPRAAYLAAQLQSDLESDGVEVLVDEATADTNETPDVAFPVQRMDETDLVVSIGGDGTFLFVARAAGSTPILGVNLGEVGFLNAVDPDEAIDVVNETVAALSADELAVRSVPRLRTDGGDWSLPPAINEIVFQASERGPGAGAEIEVRVDGSLYTGGHADGVIVSTPVGSTAYNLSGGGPLVHHSATAMIVTELCARDPMPSLVTDGSATVEVRLSGAETGYLVADGRESRSVELPALASVELGGPPVRLAGPEVDFFEALGKLS
jgi:NAD+ kinase